MVIKIPSKHIQEGWQLVLLDEGYALSDFAFSDHLRKQLTSGKITLSLKAGKKRRLVKGKLKTKETSDRCLGRKVYFYFRPNNLTRFEELITRQ